MIVYDKIHFSELKAGIAIRDSEGNELGKSKVYTYIPCAIYQIWS